MLVTAPSTYDAQIGSAAKDGRLVVKPKSGIAGNHFAGFVSKATFDLGAERISIQLRRATSGAATTIFAVGYDANNWLGFRISGRTLYCETRVDGHSSAKETAYDPERHRWLRLRPGTVAAVVVWETSADGKYWTPEFVAQPDIRISAVHVALSAGTPHAVSVPGSAEFDDFLVDKP